MADHRKDRFASFPVLALIIAGLLMLYVLSSGPTRSLAFRSYDIALHRPAGGPAWMEIAVESDEWWDTLYAPLNWVDRQPWGKPLDWYWSLFPFQKMPSS